MIFGKNWVNQKEKNKKLFNNENGFKYKIN